MEKQNLRIGIIGIGMYALWFHTPQLRNTGRVEIAAICRRSQKHLTMAEKASGVTETYTDWREMIEDVDLDAVLVSTPHHYHVEPTLAALKQGLHVLVDKPMALTSREAWEMVEAAKASERVLMVTYGPRAQGLWRSLKQQLDAGIIGRIRQINCAVTTYRRWFWQSDKIPPDVMALGHSILDVPDEFYEGWQDWHRDPTKMGGGTFVDIGVYWVDRALWLAGAPTRDLVAFTENAGLPVECFVNVQARLANGVLFSLNFADGPPRPMLGGEQQLMIVGDEGVITNDAEGQLWLHQNGKQTPLAVDQPNTTIAEAFASTILDGTENLSPAYQGANVVDFLEATYRSAAEGRIIRIDPGPQS